MPFHSRCKPSVSFLFASLLLANTAFAQIPGLPNLPGISLPSIPSTLPSLPTFPDIPGVPALTPIPGDASPPSGNANAPKAYGATTAIVSLIDARIDKLPEGRPPFVEVIALEPSKTYQKNRAKCRDDEVNQRPTDTSLCPQFEWSVPYSLLSESQEAARGLRRAWQRFEDRYFFRAITELNNPAFYFMNCWIDWGGGVNPTTPNVEIHVPHEGVPAEMDGKLEFPTENSRLHMDSYFPLPQVHNSDFCDGLSPAFLPFMYLPGFCFSVIGIQLFCTNNYPAPLWFNHQEALARVERSILKAHSDYLLDYQKDALAEILPGKRSYFLPLPWRTNIPGDGAFIAPVMDPTNFDPSPIYNTATLAKQRLNNANAAAYFFQKIVRSPTLDLLTLPGQNNLLYDPPGWWQAEEFKRLLPPSNPIYQEQLGYVSMFEAWNQLDVAILPEADLVSRALRSLIYWAVALRIDCNFEGCTVVPEPAPVAVEPYNLPFVGPRMHYGWISVPEGYGIPRVQGTPLLDYRDLLTGGR